VKVIFYFQCADCQKLSEGQCCSKPEGGEIQRAVYVPHCEWCLGVAF